MINTSAPAKSGNRYVFIDALRGIASLAVLFHHLLHNSVMEAPLRRILPKFLTIASDYGALGVQVFFVLSGFVIAHSLRDTLLTRQSLGNFILRRQIRLDPPYWTMIIIVLVLHRLELAMPSLVTTPMPKGSEVLLNFFYLHEIFGVSQVLDVGWTLCIEIQFYLAFIALLVCGKMLSKANQESVNGSSITLIFLSGCFSLAVIHFGFYPAWFIQYWFYFSAGVLCNWCLRKVTSERTFLSFLGIFSLSIIISFLTRTEEKTTLGFGMSAGLLTIIFIYIAGNKGKLTTWWNNSLLQYFGRISYSLYVVHLTTLVIFLRLAYKITGESEKAAVAWSIIAALVSIACAHLLFMTVERPSMRLAARLKTRPVADTVNI